LRVQIPLRQGVLATGQCFSLGTRVSSTNKTDSLDMTEIVLLNTITPNPIVLSMIIQ
jgi:hypothetical protein